MDQNPMKNQAPRKYDAQNGSIFTMILVGIVLFSGLSFALLQGSRSGSGQLTDQQAKLAASEIIEYSNKVQQAVTASRINGCLDTQISFESAETGVSYFNPNAPSSYLCHLFHANGGNIRFSEIDSRYTIGAGNWKYIGNIKIHNLGTTGNAALMMRAGPLKPDICIHLNKILSIENPDVIPIDDSISSPNFIGSYAALVGNSYIGDDDSRLADKKEACRQGGGGSNYYYKALIIR